MADAKKPSAPKKDAAAKGDRAATRKIAGFSRDARIHMGKDGEGKTFSAANNPRKRGAVDRFKLYKENMTLADALKAGLRSGDIRWDFNHKFITIEEPMAKKAAA